MTSLCCGVQAEPLLLRPTKTHVAPSLPKRLISLHYKTHIFPSPGHLKWRPPFHLGTGDWRKSSDLSFSRNFALASSSSSGFEEFVVVNFYKFVALRDPDEEVAKHLSFLKDLDIQGRIYVSEQGINAQYSGPSRDAFAYVEWLREDARFSDLLVQVSPALDGHAFPRLRLRYRSSLVQLEGGMSHLPMLDPSMRATAITPSEWRTRLESSSSGESYVILDVRNGYEWDVGHFSGARRPDVDCFRSTSFGLSECEASSADPLANVDKDKTNVLMYCTGGIRCDVYSTILRQQGFRNLYTLKGGVSHYLEKEGPKEWIGNLFVFDDRLSLPPSSYKPDTTTTSLKTQQGSHDSSFATCYVCGSEVSELRHRNCANPDCNLLFLCCMNCVNDLRGCCCSTCTAAPRIRPVLPGSQRYQKWHIYRSLETEKQSAA